MKKLTSFNTIKNICDRRYWPDGTDETRCIGIFKRGDKCTSKIAQLLKRPLVAIQR